MKTIFRRSVSLQKAYMEFLSQKTLSEQRRKMYISFYNALERFFRYHHLSGNLDYFSVDGLQLLKTYLENENSYMIESGVISSGSKRYLRGRNMVNDMLRKLRVFIRWCNEMGYMKESPFFKINIGNDVYAAPYYLYLEERKLLENLELKSGCFIDIQRDVFLFQCCIGCRYGDLVRLKKDNINDGFVEYIASKTSRQVRVPLNDTASAILKRYERYCNDNSLLPVANIQRYNRAIRKILEMAGINRKVPVISSRTGEVHQEYIYKIAGSHLARKTFIGNLYRMVKDPNLIGSMTGHIEGSKAFCRYRNIDDEIKREMVMKIG